MNHLGNAPGNPPGQGNGSTLPAGALIAIFAAFVIAAILVGTLYLRSRK